MLTNKNTVYLICFSRRYRLNSKTDYHKQYMITLRLLSGYLWCVFHCFPIKRYITAICNTTQQHHYFQRHVL